MARDNKICVSCGKKYSFCPNCGAKKYHEMWKNLYCSQNCKRVFDIVSDYVGGLLPASAAKEKLSECDLTTDFKQNLRARIDEIMNSTESEIVPEDEDTAAAIVPDAEVDSETDIDSESSDEESTEDIVEAQAEETVSNNGYSGNSSAVFNMVSNDYRFHKKKRR